MNAVDNAVSYLPFALWGLVCLVGVPVILYWAGGRARRLGRRVRLTLARRRP